MELSRALLPGALDSRVAAHAFILASLLRLALRDPDAADIAAAVAPVLRGVWLHMLFEPPPRPAALAPSPEHFATLLAR